MLRMNENLTTYIDLIGSGLNMDPDVNYEMCLTAAQ